ncbi:hypothetical protein P3T76_014322 [Phytophthora citrophthora]|uniref:Arrestin-like N-terminal domain-containing protein n=1 Tax=Phytophthora citrophthora TaxID=4793 RepID=A0AAD9G1X1_9STRA|nr:hypothetical protein P3T76_014322 [Phytophthora citrophthora]
MYHDQQSSSKISKRCPSLKLMAYSHTSLRNARSGNVKWTFRVALDRESYHAGDILQANVFLCVVEPLHCNGIMGCIRGEEKVTWSEKTSRRTGDEVYTRQNEFLNEKVFSLILTGVFCLN